jgi:Taurine catabolism dioxygenase TauD, TfdA family
MQRIIRTPITDASAWRGAEMAKNTSWIIHLRADHIAEIDAALARAMAGGVEVTQMKRGDFPLPKLAAEIASWSNEIQRGRGFVLVRGLPVERYNDMQVRVVFWGIGLYMGTALSQNSYGELLGDVYDEGVKMGSGKVRGYRTNSFLMFHSDRADAVGLLCLHKAKEGGISSLVSTMTIHNEILKNHPEYLEPLYHGLLYVNVEEGGDYSQWRVPIFSVHEGVLSSRCSRNTIESARKMGIAKYTELEIEALLYLDHLAAREDLRLDMDLERGDIQFINNYTTLHSRTEYLDHDDAKIRRHMVRLWLKMAQDRRPVGANFDEYKGVPKSLSRVPEWAAPN